jgi:hypothetical protein
MPINTLKGTWQRLAQNDRLKRSSQIVSVIDNHVCVFGGEVQPRQPVDDKVDVVALNSGEWKSYPSIARPSRYSSNTGQGSNTHQLTTHMTLET